MLSEMLTVSVAPIGQLTPILASHWSKYPWPSDVFIEIAFVKVWRIKSDIKEHF